MILDDEKTNLINMSSINKNSLHKILKILNTHLIQKAIMK